jgi:hypothetical protein
MPTVSWIYCDANPLASGELRRLGIAALAVEGGAWRSAFVHADRVAEHPPADVVVAPLAALPSIAAVPAGRSRIMVEVDDLAAGDEAGLEGLAAVGARVAAAVVRGEVARRAVTRAAPGIPVVQVPDVADTLPELCAAALRFGLAVPDSYASGIPQDCEVWFAEPGDRVDAGEVVELERAWRQPAGRTRVAIAEPLVLEWLQQSGIRPDLLVSGPAAVAKALAHCSVCVLPGPDDASTSRRRQKAHRHGAHVADVRGGTSSHGCDAKAVGAAWRSALSALAPQRASGGAEPLSILVFLDLVQDLDLALPLIDEMIHRPDVRLRVAMTTWLEERSPRVMAELDARGLAVERLTRPSVLQGAGPQVQDADGVLCIVETSDPAHARSHALVKRARAQGVPTFSLQHGLENVGLTMFPDGPGSPVILSDHVLVWFARENTPEVTPAALRPRLAHVGRPHQEPRTSEVRAIFDGFKQLAAVFENLHWDRYSQAYRRRFIDDCVDFAVAHPQTAVLLKPHHAGMWTSRNRAQFSQWSNNLVLADPSDPLWEPFTAPSLIAAADLVITTPSTVALDAALARKPVAVAAYGMDLQAFQPLPLLQSGADWLEFGRRASPAADAWERARFVTRCTLGGQPEKAAASFIVSMAEDGRARRRRRASGASFKVSA